MKNRIAFWVAFIVSISLIVAGFLVPPTGEIDGSVLTAVGELVAFGALYELPLMIKEGKRVKMKIGDSTHIEINNEDKEEDV